MTRLAFAAIAPAPSRDAVRLGLATLALALAGGCGSNGSKIVDPGSTGTVADSPANAARLMATAFVQRDTLAYRGLFTSDYGFDVIPEDLGPLSDPPDLTWDEEMRFAANCFRLGTNQLLPARTIVFELDSLTQAADDRPGRNPAWHQRVECGVGLVVHALDTTFEIDQRLRFYLVRGDSASVTPEIRGTGSLPDDRRWYIQRLEPVVTPGIAFAGPAAAPRPGVASVANATLGRLKLAYLAP